MRAAQLASTEPTYKSVVIIGDNGERPTRRHLATKPAPAHTGTRQPRYMVVRQKTGSSWGNLSQINNESLPPPPPPPPPPAAPVLPSKTVVLQGKRQEQVTTGLSV